jgi:hypothetical protein
VDRDWNWPINPADYANLQVVAINGQDPRDYLMVRRYLSNGSVIMDYYRNTPITLEHTRTDLFASTICSISLVGV